MTEFRFYHLQSTPLERALPGILTQAYNRGMRVVVKCGSADTLKNLNKQLWTFSPESFLPHSTDENPQDQPIWLTTKDENPNKATVLILTDGIDCQIQSEFDLCCNVFDGLDDSAVQNAREKWKALKDSDNDLKYYQQTAGGGWEQKA